MKTYVGQWLNGEPIVRVVQTNVDGTWRQYSLDFRVDLWHSLRGFNWGYVGDEPARLALAILCEHFQGQASAELRALDFYSAFERVIVAKLPSARPWRLHEDQVVEVLDLITWRALAVGTSR